MQYDLELSTAIELVQKHKAKVVCIQVPDGLKDKSNQIVDTLEKETNAKVIIWASTCFGGCDVAVDSERLGTDLIIQWGHTTWTYKV